MRALAVVTAALAISAVLAVTADAAPRRYPAEYRPAAANAEQPTRTIIHNPDGTTTIIVTPLHRRRRSQAYLHPGTGVSRGDSNRLNYMLSPTGDPGRPNWWYGPDESGGAFYIVRQPFSLPGNNPYTPF